MDIATQLQKARDLKTELLKGHNINDPQQVKELAIVKDQIAQLEQELENTDTHCEDCDNGTDTPCQDCIDYCQDCGQVFWLCICKEAK